MDKSYKIKTILREREDHFVVTFYKEDRKKLNISLGDILILKINNTELIRKVKKDFHITLPKLLLKDRKHNEEIILEILQIAKQTNCLIRPKEPFQKNKLDLRHFIPKRTKFGHPIYIIERKPNSSSIWYSVGGGVKQVNMHHFVDINKISEFLGFYFGDGTTCSSIRTLRLTNCEPSVLNYCLEILEEIGVSRDKLKCQIVYSTNKNVTDEIKARCINFWSKTLDIHEKQIVSVSESRNVRETLAYGSARINVDNAVLAEIFLHGLLKQILPRIINPQVEQDFQLIYGFLRGLLAAEGAIFLNKNKSVVKIGISFDPHSDELAIYKSLLTNLNISFGKTHANELLIYSHSNFKKLYELNAFKMHDKRNQKFIRGFENHKFSSPLA